VLKLIPNPGGELAPEEIVGRDALVEQFWEALKRQSLVLTAVRRMGKTMVLKKLRATQKGNPGIIYRDLEQVHTPLDFAEIVYEDVEEQLSVKKRTKDTARKVLEHIGGAEAAGVGVTLKVGLPPWKKLLNGALADIHAAKGTSLIFLWDELPLMIDNIMKREGGLVAMEILDTLRAMRQMYPNLRMVYTGSVGLHHVLRKLKREGYSNDPTNDMRTLEVPPLTPEDALTLARGLLEGANIITDHPYPVARAMAEAVDNIPYYIHYLAATMRSCAPPVEVENVEQIVAQVLVADADPWHLRHYEERIETYYDAQDRSAILALLDILAAVEGSLTFADIYNRFKSRVVSDDEERVRTILKLLCQDHYLERTLEGQYQFRYTLIKRWWCLNRGI
jgi:hypothetical protein